jgi:sugar fermentation stimulation protein A
MKFPDLIPAKFLRRLNRFVGEVSIEGKRVFAHIRNTGRLTELLKPGNTVFLKEKHSGKYPFELLLVDMGSSLVCIDSTITPKLYAEFLSMPVRFEPKFGEHRFDLMYDNRVVETKSANLVEDGVALFPDAPTERGRKHIQKLIELSWQGFEPQLIFVVQREDALAFSPNYKVDKPFLGGGPRLLQQGANG